MSEMINVNMSDFEPKPSQGYTPRRPLPLRNTVTTGTLFNRFHSLRRAGLFCDVTLETTSGHMIRVHSLVVVSQSTLLYNLLQEHRTVQLLCVKPDLLEACVQYMYGQDLFLSTEMAEQLAEVASLLEIEQLAIDVKQFIASRDKTKFAHTRLKDNVKPLEQTSIDEVSRVSVVKVKSENEIFLQMEQSTDSAEEEIYQVRVVENSGFNKQTSNKTKQAPIHGQSNKEIIIKSVQGSNKKEIQAPPNKHRPNKKEKSSSDRQSDSLSESPLVKLDTQDESLNDQDSQPDSETETHTETHLDNTSDKKVLSGNAVNKKKRTNATVGRPKLNKNANAVNKKYIKGRSREEARRKYHMLRKSKRYFCEECGLEFIGNYQWGNHRAMVHDRKNVCKYCGRAFYNKTGLEAHVRRHEKNNTAKCSQCEYSCPDQADLNYHMESRHSNAQYFCAFCPASFRARKVLRKHEASHNKRHTCTICPFSTGHRYHLKEHIERVHSSFIAQCPQCNKQFPSNRCLRAHQLSRHNVRLRSVSKDSLSLKRYVPPQKTQISAEGSGPTPNLPVTAHSHIAYDSNSRATPNLKVTAQDYVAYDTNGSNSRPTPNLKVTAFGHVAYDKTDSQNDSHSREALSRPGHTDDIGAGVSENLNDVTMDVASHVAMDTPSGGASGVYLVQEGSNTATAIIGTEQAGDGSGVAVVGEEGGVMYVDTETGRVLSLQEVAELLGEGSLAVVLPVKEGQS